MIHYVILNNFVTLPVVAVSKTVITMPAQKEAKSKTGEVRGREGKGGMEEGREGARGEGGEGGEKR